MQVYHYYILILGNVLSLVGLLVVYRMIKRLAVIEYKRYNATIKFIEQKLHKKKKENDDIKKRVLGEIREQIRS